MIMMIMMMMTTMMMILIIGCLPRILGGILAENKAPLGRISNRMYEFRVPSAYIYVKPPTCSIRMCMFTEVARLVPPDTPNLPTKIIPTKIAWKIPYGHENSTP